MSTNPPSPTMSEMAQKLPDPINRVKHEIKQIDSQTWVIGPVVLHRSATYVPNATWHDPLDNSYYTIDESSPLIDADTVEPDTPFIRFVREAGTESAVWTIGSNAFCKVRVTYPGVTPESTTLKAVKARNFSFATPTVFHHAFGPEINYLFLERVPGITLEAAWLGLDQTWRKRYATRVAEICEEMAQWKGSRLGGIDGQVLVNYYLRGSSVEGPFSVEQLYDGCKDLGMDVNELVFAHGDMGPTNIMVEEKPVTGKVGIIDFEDAGFYPKEWILTIACVSAGYVVEAGDDIVAWKRLIIDTLRERGFKDVTDAWCDRWEASKRARGEE